MDKINSIKRFRADKPSDLLLTQKPAVRHAINQFASVLGVALDYQSRRKGAANPDAGDDVERPHSVVFIDGGRGAGKTYTLLSIQHALEAVHWNRDDHPSADSWDDFADCVRSSHAKKLKDLAQSPLQVMKLIFPGDMGPHERVMEVVIASMMHRLDAQLQKHRSNPEKVASFRALQTALIEDVAQGWYFSRQLGQEAIAHDALDYAHFARRLEEETRKSARRIEHWRDFVSRYLDEINTAVLVVMLDDSDVRPEITADILETLRLYMNHPRIMVVLAGNIRSMRNALVLREMRELGLAMNALSKRDGQTANDWRRLVRKGIEDYLEKVLPTAKRLFVQRPRLTPDASASGTKESDDFQKIFGRTLQEVCETMLRHNRKEFLGAKFALARLNAMRRLDTPTRQTHRPLEHYLSWWLFANRYFNSLAPQSARQVINFRDHYAGLMDATKVGRQKRLIMALFDNATNFSLIQQTADDVESIINWLQNQELESYWVDQRLFRINGRNFERGSFGYDYIRYRLDLGIALPVKDNPEEAVPANLLPVPAGRRHIRRFFRPKKMYRRQRNLGVAKWIDHAAVPGNGIYFFDLEAIPYVSLQRGGTSELRAANRKKGGSARTEDSSPPPGAWEAWLADNWSEVIEDGQDEQTYRYFTEVVCRSQHDMAEVTPADLSELLDPVSQTAASGALYEKFVEYELKLFWPGDTNPEQDNYENLPWTALELPPGSRALPPDKVLPERRRRALYAAMITDVRRAWHSIRMHDQMTTVSARSQASRAKPGGESSYEDSERAGLAIIANQDRLALYGCDQVRGRLAASTWGKGILQVFTQERLLEIVNDQDAITRLQQHIANLPSVVGEITKSRELLSERLAIITQPIGGPITTNMNETKRESAIDQFFGRERLPFNVVDNVIRDDEEASHDTWVTILRHVGRLICSRWPDFGTSHAPGNPEQFLDEDAYPHTDSALSGLEARLFGPEHGDASQDAPQLHFFRPKSAKDANDEVMRRRGEDARNFLLFVYGLAPSLPALIHSEVMGIVHYELRQLTANEVPDDRRREILERAFECIRKWEDLIGSVAFVMRYVRVKYLHLHTALFFTHLETASASTAVELLTEFGFKPPSIEVADATVKRLTYLFVGEGWEIESNLALLPDVSAYTLFGDNWVRDTVISLHTAGYFHRELKLNTEAVSPASAYTSMQVTGVFPETEQWLWAANRCLRKLASSLDTFFKTKPLPKSNAPADAEE